MVAQGQAIADADAGAGSQPAAIAGGDAIRVLFIEDVASEAELALHQLRRAGIVCSLQRVDSEPALRQALREFRPTVILSDFTLPHFDGLAALAICREMAPDVPFIFVSGTIGEERAIEALHRGAVDYVLKTNLSRLAPAVRRAIEEAAARVERQRQEKQIARLTRVLRMLSGINGVVIRIRERQELLSEACRLAVSVGGYASAIVMLKQSGTTAIQPVAWMGREPHNTELLRATLVESGARDSSIVGRVLRSGRAFVCNDTVELSASATSGESVEMSTLTSASTSGIMLLGGYRSLVALPLSIDKTTLGVFVLTAAEAGTVSDEELQMLREVAANLSFALQYLQKDSTVRWLSHFDGHTGLAKRSLFCERLARQLARAGNRQTRRAVAVIDVEKLSVINDSFGRHVGDTLLQHASDRLRRHFNDTELLAQLGGGTFVVAIEILGNNQDPAKVLLGHMDSVFGEPFELDGNTVPVVVKSGLAVHPQHGKEATELLQNAEAALRNARASGRRNLQYSLEQHSTVKAQLALEHKLRAALAQNQFVLHYQSKVNIKTRVIDSAEALIRWNDPDSGLVSPAVFLPVLESTGLITEVGDWVIEQAARDCQHWLRLGLPSVRVAVNVSPLQLRRVDFAQGFLKAVQSWATARHGLDIEITEGALFDDSAAELNKLKQLRAAGVRIAIDDFGTGYSSLSRLSSLPIDTLKIDRTFVTRLPADRSGKTLVSTMISLAHAFDMTVVAEGVETSDQLGALWQMGCDQAQGYLLSKPVSRDEFAALLEQNRRRSSK
jgi:diguanylate cyclase (GGDEF)-like protein